ncbi:type II toxin-antitoxin system RelE/ParE family toxin [Chryseobacterium sp.]|uniref:type II toxin-antitoxin system RelE/ParE family toxin n=1 Tax=Chryseobacterium sp. TaxID=1871047 RepID=UPI00289A7247|nr:type II toxin-antitoxin system RelE/ParE family toxin [Chryseobacterium sp.]
MSKKIYILSEIADKDLEDIFDYTLDEFGFDQAKRYLLELEKNFQNLLLNPQLGKKRDEIKKGLYSLPKDNHIIFYRILQNHIKIIRVLHGSREIPKYFL